MKHNLRKKRRGERSAYYKTAGTFAMAFCEGLCSHWEESCLRVSLKQKTIQNCTQHCHVGAIFQRCVNIILQVHFFAESSAALEQNHSGDREQVGQTSHSPYIYVHYKQLHALGHISLDYILILTAGFTQRQQFIFLGNTLRDIRQ